MTREEVQRLLHEASFQNCSRDQLNGIINRLREAIPVDASRHNKRGEIEREILSDLFWTIVNEDPRQLPSQLPVFTHFCRDREPVQVDKRHRRSRRNRRAS